MDPYSIIIKPHLTEKSMNAIDKNNELTFVVRRTSRGSGFQYSDFVSRMVPRIQKVMVVLGAALLVALGSGASYRPF